MVDAANDAGLALVAAMHAAAFNPMGEKGWSKKSLAALTKQSHITLYIASIGDVPVGFAMMGCVAGEAEIISLGVLPDHQNRKLGTEMLAAVLSEVKMNGFERVFLEVREDNAKARALYASLGFERTGTRKDYYRTEDGKHRDAAVYSKDLLVHNAVKA